jgi:hypothetical protein
MDPNYGSLPAANIANTRTDIMPSRAERHAITRLGRFCRFSSNGLDFSHNDGTFHRDTANPYNFPIGTLEHLGVDVIYGNFVYIIPRP